MVVNRYGDDHPPPARLAIEAGVPTFVDKPFANDMEDIQMLVALAAARDVPLMSCSAVRYAVEVYGAAGTIGGLRRAELRGRQRRGRGATSPIRVPNTPFSTAFIRSSCCTRCSGSGAVAVTTRRTERCDVGHVQYEDGRQGIVNLLHATPSLYHGAVFGADDWGEANVLDFNQFYVETLARVIQMAVSGRPPIPIAWSVEVMAIMAALVQSCRGRRAHRPTQRAFIDPVAPRQFWQRPARKAGATGGGGPKAQYTRRPQRQSIR